MKWGRLLEWFGYCKIWYVHQGVVALERPTILVISVLYLQSYFSTSGLPDVKPYAITSYVANIAGLPFTESLSTVFDALSVTIASVSGFSFLYGTSSNIGSSSCWCYSSSTSSRLKVREIHPTVKVLLMSALNIDNDLFDSFQGLASSIIVDGFMQKPISMRNLNEIVQKTILGLKTIQGRRHHYYHRNYVNHNVHNPLLFFLKVIEREIFVNFCKLRKCYPNVIWKLIEYKSLIFTVVYHYDMGLQK